MSNTCCVVFLFCFCFVLCTLYCQFLWIILFWPLPLYSLTFIHSIILMILDTDFNQMTRKLIRLQLYVCITLQILYLSFPYFWLVIVFVTIVTKRVPQMEQKLSTLSEHMSSLSIFRGIRVAKSLVFCVIFYISLIVPLFASGFPFGIIKLYRVSEWLLLNTNCSAISCREQVSYISMRWW